MKLINNEIEKVAKEVSIKKPNSNLKREIMKSVLEESYKKPKENILENKHIKITSLLFIKIMGLSLICNSPISSITLISITLFIFFITISIYFTYDFKIHKKNLL